MSEWHPIETAPKEYTPILLYSKAIGIAIGWWMGLYRPEAATLEGWGPWGDGNGRFSLNDDEEPTHWMSLPEPPEHGR